jgi:hypothetical protein
MFGKISKRYYQDRNTFGPNILVGSIVLVLLIFCIASIRTAEDRVLEGRHKKELVDAAESFKGTFKDYDYAVTFDSVVCIGNTKDDPSPITRGNKLSDRQFKHRVKYRVCGVRGLVEGSVLDSDIFIVYSQYPLGGDDVRGKVGKIYRIYSEALKDTIPGKRRQG